MPKKTAHPQPRLHLRSKQRGWALLELGVALAISAILAVYINQARVQDSQEATAKGLGTYLATTSAALENHVLLNWNTLSVAVPTAAGTAIPLRPTFAELQALGRIPGAFPPAAPAFLNIRYDITRQNCPGANCTLIATSCSTTPLTFGAAQPRYDLLQAAMDAMKGTGGYSRMNDGPNIRGPGLNIPNPVAGSPVGIICGASTLNTATFQSFLRINEPRDPNFQGPVTIAGPVTNNSTLTVNGATNVNNNLAVTGQATVGPCINLAGGAQGRAGFGCANPADVPAGYTGGVRSADVVAQANILASTNPAGFTGANGNFALITANNGTGVAEIRTSGRAAADRLTPIGSYAIGTACPAADEGSIARIQGGAVGLVSCMGGTWRALHFQAAEGDGCAQDGRRAETSAGILLVCINGTYQGMDKIMRPGTVNQACTDIGSMGFDTTNQNEALLCHLNLAGGTSRWMRLRDMTTHMVFVRTVEVPPNAQIAKPNCNSSVNQTSQQVLNLVPKVVSTPDGGMAVFAESTDTTWTVRMHDGNGNSLTGSPNATALAHIYCYFP